MPMRSAVSHLIYSGFQGLLWYWLGNGVQVLATCTSRDDFIILIHHDGQ